MSLPFPTSFLCGWIINGYTTLFLSIHQLMLLFIFLAIMNSPGVMIHVQSLFKCLFSVWGSKYLGVELLGQMMIPSLTFEERNHQVSKVATSFFMPTSNI